MNPPAKAPSWIIGIGFLLILFTLALVFVLAGLKSTITSRKKAVELPVYGQIADFSLTNQNYAVVSLKDLRGQVWVADIIFTRCPGPCARMTRQMKELQDGLTASDRAKLVSLTTDPDYDKPAILQKYADNFGAASNRWQFLTGTKKQIGDLAIDSLKLTAVEKTPEQRENPNDLFVHSTIFVVVDKQARLRGVFETGGEDVSWPQQKQKILEAVRQLEREQ